MKQPEKSRYKTNILDDDEVEGCDFSRDEEDVGIGSDDDADRMGVLFDDEDLFGEKGNKKVKTNKTKMMLDELEGGFGVADRNDTDQSYVQPTFHDDDMGTLTSARGMVREPNLIDIKRSNALTKSLGLPNNSSTKDGSGDKISQKSNGILGLSGINIDFRKSKDGLKQLFSKSKGPEQSGAAVVSSSIEFAQMRSRQ